MDVIEGIGESTKMDLGPTKKYTKSHKTLNPARLQIRKGRELGGNHDMSWPTSSPVSIEDDLLPGPPSS